MKKQFYTLIAVCLTGLVLSISFAQAPVQVSITNTIQGAFTENVEAPYGQDVGFQEIGSGLELDDTATGFVYDISVSETGLSMAWVSNENNDKLARVIEDGTFDRYYIKFDQPILAGASVNTKASLTPDIISISDSELVIQVGPGMEVGPGFDAELVFGFAEPALMTIRNTIQGSFTQNFEAPFGNNTAMVVAGSMHLGSDLTAFVYDATIADGILSMSWISNENNDKLARVIEDGTFDRYYITFSEDMVSNPTVTSASTLSPDIVSSTANSVVIQVGPGMQVGPGQDFHIALDGSTVVNKPVIEILTFRLQEGASEEEFVALSKHMQNTFVSKQVGYISRTTSKTEDGNWQIAVHWNTMADSEVSMAGFGSAEGAEGFLGLIDMETFKLSHSFVQ